MILTVLGCWSPYPRAGGACPGYLVQSEGSNILIDCGNGVFSNLQKYIDFRTLDGIIISHLHPDHYLDLFCLRHAIEIERRIQPGFKPVPVYMPDEPADSFTKLARFTEAFAINSVVGLPGAESNGLDVRQAKIGRNVVKFIKTDHPIPTYAVSVEGEQKLFYSADTKWADYLTEFAREANVALCEASLIEENKNLTSVGHLTCRQAGELARLAEAGQLVATHFWPGYEIETLKSEAETGFGREVVIAHEGLQITVK